MFFSYKSVKEFLKYIEQVLTNLALFFHRFLALATWPRGNFGLRWVEF